MAAKIIQIEAHDNFKGFRGSLSEDGGIIEKEEKTAKSSTSNQKTSQSDEGVETMEITQKEYVDQRMDSLEKSIDQRFSSSEKLLSEKMDHLFSRLEGAIDNQNTKMDGKIELLNAAFHSNLSLVKQFIWHV